MAIEECSNEKQNIWTVYHSKAHSTAYFSFTSITLWMEQINPHKQNSRCYSHFTQSTEIFNRAVNRSSLFGCKTRFALKFTNPVLHAYFIIPGNSTGISLDSSTESHTGNNLNMGFQLKTRKAASYHNNWNCQPPPPYRHDHHHHHHHNRNANHAIICVVNRFWKIHFNGVLHFRGKVASNRCRKRRNKCELIFLLVLIYRADCCIEIVVNLCKKLKQS